MEAEERPSKRPRLSEEADQDLCESNGGVNVKQTSPTEGTTAGESNENDGVPILNGVEANDKDEADFGKPSTTEDGEKDVVPVPEETAPLGTNLNGDQSGPPMSKNQQKKLRKQQEWESKREERKVIRKQKVVAKRERKKAARDQAIENGEPPPMQNKERQKHVLLPVTFIIDCDFDELMRDPERKSLAAQITRSYSDNRKAPYQAHLAVCSFGGQLKERFDNVLTHHKSWRGIRFMDCDFVEAAEKAKDWMSQPQKGGSMDGVFSKYTSPLENASTEPPVPSEGEIVYLTSESPNTLTDLKPHSTYIIGGLVDKNREKGICYKRATERGIKTARLPIGEFMDMQSRKVLATNHVNEIMVRWLECGDWGEAFLKVIPKRKGGRLKGAAGGADGDTGEDGGEDDGDEMDPEAEGDGGSEEELHGDLEADGGVLLEAESAT